MNITKINAVFTQQKGNTLAQFTNQAQLTYNNFVRNSNVAVGEILEVLSATKNAVVGEYTAGDDITYIISIVNTGNTAYSNLSITDNLGAYTLNTQTLVPLSYKENSVKYYVNGTIQTPPNVVADNNLSISGINVPAGGNAMIVYEATPNQYAPLDTTSQITNEAVISTLGITPITVTETVNSRNEANLSITKSINPIPVAENGQLTYTFLIQNTGNTAVTADDNAIVTDIFDPILENISVTFNSTTWSLNTNYTYDETTGSFATVAGQIIVPAATYTQNAATGEWTTTPGTATLVVTGNI